ncbi:MULTISPECIES: hypothetical protein [Oscillatoriales]|jgi:hypothetical protein|uniref:Uncharacterized protein n=1 Tax=Limnospira platensis NIES-46 TaxID=1236695 RepID=A0A5M3T7T5_LIMPL|nr:MULTISPECIES: hypothetical protein [Arthrospira]AMW26676.1 hypothetical protein AP285_00360 [Arthrospira platensis YZ]KDR56319.1 hypothetical protein APPUASWS_017275 [Arthrospira platensis str. Paraca]MBD2667569.1 hypothetical protein [Arthrospira platensis FACHB-439]MDF2209074.1 hypothetical protein [Arthrospira platensis NCB002]MDT9181189.1 hypothetical protein [Limnospira sp. PMC 289.06]MDT9293617.1 hypothetical protein [Arthrospira platensis PCC 7345]MDT9308865.1 hypothetical protein 
MSNLILTSQEIAQFRSQLAEYSSALQALDMIEDCEGDIEDAAISMAINVGQSPTTSENWLDGLAKRHRVTICEPTYQEDLLQSNIAPIVAHLIYQNQCPPLLVTPVVIYVLKTGIEQFCEPLKYKKI